MACDRCRFVIFYRQESQYFGYSGYATSMLRFASTGDYTI